MPRAVVLSPPPTRSVEEIFPSEFSKWIEEFYNRVGMGPLKIQGYQVSSLPSAGENGSTSSGNEFTSLIFVSDETGGPTLAFSDGTDWRRVQDRTIVS